VFVRTHGKRSSVWIAEADGSTPRVLAATNGWGAELSPDGRRVAYYVANGGDDTADLYVRDAEGGKPELIGKAREAHWSPDGARLAVDDGKSLLLVDVESGQRREVVRGDVGGWWWGFSFAPDGKSLGYVRGVTNLRGTDEYRSDIFVVRLSDGETQQLTHDGHSDRPVLGRDWLAYRHFRFEGEGIPEWAEGFVQIGELRLMHPDGSGDRAFAQGDVNTPDDHYGLEPLEFSEDGKRLLACASADYSCAPVTFTVPDGERRDLSIEGKPEIYARDLARDGSEVLVEAGPLYGPWPTTGVYAVPVDGASARVLVKDAFSPSWAH
jgi:hypothetical protein